MRSPLAELPAVTAVLQSEGIAHALIGGWAVITWGFLRASDDFDLLIDLPRSGRGRLLKALASGWEAEWIEGGEDDPIPGLIRAKPREGGLPIDLLPARSAADREALSRALEVSVEGTSVMVVAPEDLLAMKLEAGGGQDFEDARRLLTILSGKLDMKTVRERCTQRRVADLLDRIYPPKK
jgi:predicted nucleotidyltransferase